MSMPYKISRPLRGPPQLKFKCPNCAEPLQNSVTEAGKSDGCPQCKIPFTVPGETVKQNYLKQQEKAAADAEARKAEKARARAESERHYAEKVAKEEADIAAAQAKFDEEQAQKQLKSLTKEDVHLGTIAYELREMRIAQARIQSKRVTAGYMLMTFSMLFGVVVSAVMPEFAPIFVLLFGYGACKAAGG